MSKTIRKRRDFESRARTTKHGIRKSWRETPYDGEWEEEAYDSPYRAAPFDPSLGSKRRRDASDSGISRR